MPLKNEIRKKLLKYYEKYGLSPAIQIAESVLKSSLNKKDFSFTAILHGEICETVLEIVILDYRKLHREETKHWISEKGIILKDKDCSSSDFLTELDYTLFTPECIYLFECKSYAGSNQIIGNGVIKRQYGASFDVYKQNKLHEEMLTKYVLPFRIRGCTTKMQLIMFDFSLGNTIDKRGIKEKAEMPCVTCNNVTKLLRGGNVVWDINYLRKAVMVWSRESEKLQDKHLKFVKSLHG